jgi:hypothetical protein
MNLLILVLILTLNLMWQECRQPLTLINGALCNSNAFLFYKSVDNIVTLIYNKYMIINKLKVVKV